MLQDYWSNCPDCGTEVQPEQKKCHSCGFDLLEDEPTFGEAEAGIDPDDF